MGPKTRKRKGQEGGAPKGGAQKGRDFRVFSFSRLKFHYLCSFWASSRGISVVFSKLFGWYQQNLVTIGYCFFGGQRRSHQV